MARQAVHRAIKTQKVTKRARFSTTAERYVPGWDGTMNEAPRHERLRERREMGTQQVPIGPKGSEPR